MAAATSGSERFGHAALATAVAVAAAAIAFVAGAPGGIDPGDAPQAAAIAAVPAGREAPCSPPPAAAAAAESLRPAPEALAEPQPGPEAREAAGRLHERLRRLARDLEFTPGLREPPQQVVLERPEPWRPDPLASEEERPVIRDVQPRSAPVAGGTPVTIRGANLRVTQVMFGIAAARIVGTAPDAITVLAPRAPEGRVSIVVTNDDGTYAISGEPFTYQR